MSYLEDYRIMRVLGSGAFATVKLATHESTGKRVALKIYSSKQVTGIQALAVEQEIKNLRQLNSDFTPKLFHDFEADDGRIILVMEYIGGNSLLQIMKGKYRKGVPL